MSNDKLPRLNTERSVPTQTLTSSTSIEKDARNGQEKKRERSFWIGLVGLSGVFFFCWRQLNISLFTWTIRGRDSLQRHVYTTEETLCLHEFR